MKKNRIDKRESKCRGVIYHAHDSGHNKLRPYMMALFFILMCSPPPIYAGDMAVDISDRGYFQKLREFFALAKKTIDISLEAVAVNDRMADPVAALIRDLTAAQKRGVRVRLFLNTFTPAGTQGSLFLHDDILWSLRREGVEIHFVSPSHYLKDQLVVIDGREVLEGGLRWTEQDLERGLASATHIASEALAEKKRLRLEFLPLWDVEQKRSEKTEGRVAVPFYLIHELRYFPQMVIHDDGDAMKIYLALLRIFYQVQDVRLHAVYEELGREIPAGQFFERQAVVFEVLKAIARLETEYELIQIEKKESDRALIRMIFPSQKDAVIKIPVFFFQEGFSKTLTPQAVFAYLVISYKTQISGEAPVWLGSERNVEQDFPVSQEQFRAGVAELRQRNLIEVFPFVLQGGIPKRSALEYRYFVNPVPTLSERLETWDRLRQEFGEDAVQKAQEMAGLLGEPEDPKVMAAYLNLLKHFKDEDVMALTQRLATLPPESTPARLDYLRTLLEHETSPTQLATA